MIEAKVAEIRLRLKKEVLEALKEVGDVVEEISRDVAEIKPLVERDPQLMVNLLADILIEDAKIPKYIPRFAVRFVLARILKKYL